MYKPQLQALTEQSKSHRDSFNSMQFGSVYVGFGGFLVDTVCYTNQLTYIVSKSPKCRMNLV